MNRRVGEPQRSRLVQRYEALTDAFFAFVDRQQTRPARRPLDWRYNHRDYLLVPLALMFGLFGGLDLLSNEPLWQKATGIALLAATFGVAGALVLWLLRPVDSASLKRLQEYHEDMKWRNIWKGYRGSAQADPKAVSLNGDGIRAVRFHDQLRGYDPMRVDDLLERVAKEVDAGRSPGPLLRVVDLGQKWRGYDPADVDALITRLKSSRDQY